MSLLSEGSFKTFLRHTVNVYIFAQYIFSHISRRVLDARKYDVSEKINHYNSDRINYRMRENWSTRKYNILYSLMREHLAARKYLRSQYLVGTKLSGISDLLVTGELRNGSRSCIALVTFQKPFSHICPIGMVNFQN